MSTIKDLIGFDFEKSDFVLGSHDLDGQKIGNDLKASKSYMEQTEALLAEMGRGWSLDDHLALAQAITEPIMKIVPYVEMYSGTFFMQRTVGDDEDPRIPVEDVVSIAWETHMDGSARPVRAGFQWTRPEFKTFDTSMEVPWNLMRKAGWNVFARQMRYATWNLARKRDEIAQNVYIAAVLPSHVTTISGGALTKAAVDTVIKGAKDIGFPVMRALCNPGTLADMTDFVWPVGVYLPSGRVEQLIRTLVIQDYGGIEWHVNPNFPTNRVRFGGLPEQIGWHTRRGTVRNTSQVEARKKLDFYLIEDQEHNFYVGNDLSLWEIRITA